MPTDRIYRTYSALGTRLDGAVEKLSIMETELPNTLLLYIGDRPEPGREILISRGLWELLQSKTGQFNYSDFTWVSRSAAPAEAPIID